MTAAPSGAVGAASSLRCDTPGLWVIAGDLTQFTVPELHAQGRQLELAGDLLLDLAAVERIDSAALALLLSLARRSHQSGGRLTIRHAPAGLVSLADLCGVRALLALAPA